jgi:hypothetical protein
MIVTPQVGQTGRYAGVAGQTEAEGGQLRLPVERYPPRTRPYPTIRVSRLPAATPMRSMYHKRGSLGCTLGAAERTGRIGRVSSLLGPCITFSSVARLERMDEAADELGPSPATPQACALSPAPHYSWAIMIATDGQFHVRKLEYPCLA